MTLLSAKLHRIYTNLERTPESKSTKEEHVTRARYVHPV